MSLDRNSYHNSLKLSPRVSVFRFTGIMIGLPFTKASQHSAVPEMFSGARLLVNGTAEKHGKFGARFPRKSPRLSRNIPITSVE